MVNKIYGKESITHYNVISFFSDIGVSLVECKLDTGRTHQIRLHMSYIGNSVVGDKLYGKNQKKISLIQNEKLKNITRQALHSYYLEFNHPINNSIMKFEIDLPIDMKNLLI